MPQSSTTNGATDSQHLELIRSLTEHPYRFDFFQAVRLLTRGASHATSNKVSDKENLARPVGHDYAPHREIVRFRAFPSHSFSSAEIISFVPSAPQSGQIVAEMTVSFLGLIGPVGALPQHYTQTIIDRLRLKDYALRDFLDLFNHRTISLFYRAWEKHHVPPLLERAKAEQQEDSFTRALFCLVGLGRPALRDRLEVEDETFLYYAGLFAHYPRNALSLENMLTDFLQLPAIVQQFQGEWLDLETQEQTALPGGACPEGLNCQLGVTAIAGERVWSIESRFRLRLGPMNYREFCSFYPQSRRLRQLGQLVRTYAGPELDFDVQLVLQRQEVPFCQLKAGESDGPRLGWNTWACSQTPSTHAEEAVFVSDGRPSR